MSTVEIETGQFVKRYAFWNPATWSIPKLYWDAWSQEQRLHAICRQLEKVIAYADYLGVNIDDIAARLKAIEEGQLDEFIIAAIEAWFEENEPEIANAIEQLQADVSDISDEIGEGFDAENTVAAAIGNIESEIGEGFSAENTVASEIATLKKNGYREVNFKCIDRFIAGDFGSTGNSAAQAGCLFVQNDIRYWAQAMHDSSNEANDRLVIRNVDSNTTASDTTMNISHGYSLTYNATTEQLLTHSSTLEQLIIIDVSNPASPSIDETINFAGLGLGSVMCSWYGQDIALLEWNTQKIYVVDRTLDIKAVYDLSFDDSAMPQNFQYNADTEEYYIGCSSPNCVIIIDAISGTQKNVLMVPDWIGFIYMRELETCMRNGDKIYTNNYENVDGFMVVSVLESDLVHGTVTSDILPYIQPSGNIGTNINYNDGTLMPQVDMSSAKFKLAGDAIKWAQSVGAYGMIFLNIETDYPKQIRSCGAEIAIQSSNTNGVTLHAIICERGMLRIVPTNITIIPDYAYSSSVHSAIHLLDSSGIVDGNAMYAIDNTDGYTGPCQISLAGSQINCLRPTDSYTVNLVSSILFANVASTVTKLTNYRSTTITSN